MTAPVRVRFAPSPTGYLHLGGARTALYNYIFARGTAAPLCCASRTPTRRAPPTRRSPRSCARCARWSSTGTRAPRSPALTVPTARPSGTAIYREHIERLLAAGPPLHLLPHARGARGRASGGSGREARLGLQRRLPRPCRRTRSRAAPGGRRALDAALQGAPRHDGLRRHAARPGRGRKRDHRRLHRAALRRHRHLQPGGGRRRRDDGGEPRHPRRRPPSQHAQAGAHLRGAGRARAAVPAHAAALRHRPQEALQASRRHQSRAAHRDGLSGRGGAQLPLFSVDRVRRVDDRPGRSPTWCPLRRREPGHQPQHLRPREAALDERALHLRALAPAELAARVRAYLERVGFYGQPQARAGARRAGRRSPGEAVEAGELRAAAARRRAGAPDRAVAPLVQEKIEVLADFIRLAGWLFTPARHRRRSPRALAAIPDSPADPARGASVRLAGLERYDVEHIEAAVRALPASSAPSPRRSSPRCAWA